MEIYPVIHFIDRQTALQQVDLAYQHKVAGVFLISHRGADSAVVEAAREAKASYPTFKVGINLLSTEPIAAAILAKNEKLDMIWADNMGVSSKGLTATGKQLAQLAESSPALAFFSSIAFKYQPVEHNPVLAAKRALDAGFIPTTSGLATGHAPDVAKVEAMSLAARHTLAIASGMTPDNIADYAPFLSHVLVATGIALDAYRIDPGALTRFISAAGQKPIDTPAGISSIGLYPK